MVLNCVCLVGYKEHGVMVVMLDGVMVGTGVPGYEQNGVVVLWWVWVCSMVL